MLDYILWLLYVVLGIAAVISLYRKYTERKKTKQEEDDRAQLFFFNKLENVQAANHEFEALTSESNGFFSNYALNSWKEKFASLFAEVPHKSLNKAGQDTVSIDLIRQFIENCNNASKLRHAFNAGFVKSELNNYASFFDNIEHRKLDPQQRLSIVSDEDNGLVIAGAGSGKTTTIIGKVNYIIHRYKVNPAEILLISFTRKSAAELSKRINIAGVNVKTFHRFGMDIIAEVENRQPSMFDPDQFKRFVRNAFKLLLQNEAYLEKVTDHFLNFSRIEQEADSFEDQGQYFQYLQDQNFESYKLKEVSWNDRTTLKREVVKSVEECKIANFLLLNNIDYEYELPYEHETATQNFRQYRPDFTINPKGKRIYLEHFAINKTGTVPKWFAKEDEGQTWESATKAYQDGIQAKRELHQKQGTTLIETFSYEMADDTLFENLTKKLAAQGISVIPKSSSETWQIILEASKEEVENIITLFETIISLLKANNYTVYDLLKRNASTSNLAIRKHNASIIGIVAPIYEMYQQHLADRKEIDFSDAINAATAYVATQKYTRKYRYIIIDEFQDISIGRYKLVQALKQSNPECKIFAVGDDWQSIYRFTGSDISLFREFENYFGYTIKSKIETTYRFKAPVISVTSNFILKNPNQEKKMLKAANTNKKTNLKILYSENEKLDDTRALKQALDELFEIDQNLASKSIFVLGRYSFDLKRVRNEEGLFNIDRTTGVIKYKTRKALKEQEITAQFLTVHKSKGLEADVVIVINCNTGVHGFPTEISDDPVLNLLLSEGDQFDNSEERRLFYVAMTRAKENLILITNTFNKSKFIRELETSGQPSPSKKCPRCKSADLRLRAGETNGKEWSFYGCSNYIYGCDYKEWVKNISPKR